MIDHSVTVFRAHEVEFTAECNGERRTYLISRAKLLGPRSTAAERAMPLDTLFRHSARTWLEANMPELWRVGPVGPHPLTIA